MNTNWFDCNYQYRNKEGMNTHTTKNPLPKSSYYNLRSDDLQHYDHKWRSHESSDRIRTSQHRAGSSKTLEEGIHKQLQSILLKLKSSKNSYDEQHRDKELGPHRAPRRVNIDELDHDDAYWKFTTSNTNESIQGKNHEMIKQQHHSSQADRSPILPSNDVRKQRTVYAPSSYQNIQTRTPRSVSIDQTDRVRRKRVVRFNLD